MRLTPLKWSPRAEILAQPLKFVDKSFQILKNMSNELWKWYSSFFCGFFSQHWVIRFDSVGIVNLSSIFWTNLIWLQSLVPPSCAYISNSLSLLSCTACGHSQLIIHLSLFSLLLSFLAFLLSSPRRYSSFISFRRFLNSLPPIPLYLPHFLSGVFPTPLPSTPLFSPTPINDPFQFTCNTGLHFKPLGTTIVSEYYSLSHILPSHMFMFCTRCLHVGCTNSIFSLSDHLRKNTKLESVLTAVASAWILSMGDRGLATAGL